MISVQELESLCNDRLEDAKSLYHANRYDGAVYLCGYVVEMGLKNGYASLSDGLAIQQKEKNLKDWHPLKRMT